MAKAIEYGIRGSAKKAISQIHGSGSKTKYGIQGSAKKATEYGLRTPKSNFDLGLTGRGEKGIDF